MGKAKGLLRSQRLLELALTYAKRSKTHLFHVYVSTTHLHLVDESGFLLPVECLDVLNLCSFLKPNSYRELNLFSSVRVGDVHPE